MQAIPQADEAISYAFSHCPILPGPRLEIFQCRCPVANLRVDWLCAWVGFTQPHLSLHKNSLL